MYKAGLWSGGITLLFPNLDCIWKQAVSFILLLFYLLEKNPLYIYMYIYKKCRERSLTVLVTVCVGTVF